MKLKENYHQVKTDGLEKVDFSIGNSGFIFELLSNKLYKNPYQAVVRELSINAVDANVENRKDRPIEVHLPTYQCPYLAIKDNGIGISPDRVVEFYTKLGESTKRNTNKQVGCIGIGRLSSFSVADQFTVETIYENRKYVYIVYKQSNGVPTISSDNYEGEPTDEPSGTKITVPIKRNDIDSVASEGLDLFRFFKHKPICNLKLTKYNPLFKGDFYEIDTGDGKVYAVMGSIVYPIECSKFVNNNVYLHFNIGELSIGTARDSLTYDDKTSKAIQNKIDLFKADIKAKIAEQLKGLQGWQLYCKQNELSSKFGTFYYEKVDIELPKEYGPYLNISYYYKHSKYIETSIQPEYSIQFVIQDKGLNSKALKEWGRLNNKRIWVIENDKTKIKGLQDLLGLDPAHFKYTSEFATKRGTFSIRGVTKLVISDTAKDSFETIDKIDIKDIKYYVIRNGTNIAYNNQLLMPKTVIRLCNCKQINGYATYKNEQVYAILSSQVKSVNAINILEETEKKLEKSLTEDDLLSIVKAKRIKHFTYWHDIPLINDAIKESDSIQAQANKASNMLSSLHVLGKTRILPTFDGKLKCELIHEADTILHYVYPIKHKSHNQILRNLIISQLNSKGLK